MGAPMQVQNPDHIGKLRAVLDIPITTALESGAAAVKAFGATDILLLTPFDDGLNTMLRDFLASQGVRATFPVNNRTDTRREDVQATEQKTAEEVYQLAVDAFATTFPERRRSTSRALRSTPCSSSNASNPNSACPSSPAIQRCSGASQASLAAPIPSPTADASSANGRPAASERAMNERLCETCDNPLDALPGGGAQCPACLAVYDADSFSDDTVIEEGLALSDVLRIVNEARR